ncbi:MAG: cyclic nucleotide-binding domain-containing protein [Rhodospirillales bacterium]|nr:cyclic nucleotide-binding domain-containing protein [Rhodospirillales bacterium]MDP6883792.1 cyclic nucleotide-binding domain-containing protein [Rhodospirillales bacterium]
MKKSDTHFQDGEIIFREGEPSRSAFIIVEGDVELTKKSDKGSIILALLKPGEMIGEMGIFDQSPRSATARAVGTVTVNAIAREEFLESLKKEPDTAFRFMGKLVDRLRTANELLVRGPTIETPARERRVKPGFLDRLLGMRPGTGARHVRPQSIEIRVAPLAGDANARVTRHVAQALAKRRRVKVRVVKETL